MDHFDKLRGQVTILITLGVLALVLFLIGAFWLLAIQFELMFIVVVPITALSAISLGYLLARHLASRVLEPISYVWKAILHVSPEHGTTAAPNLEQAKMGRELVTSLVMQVYQLASQESELKAGDVNHRKYIIQAANVVSHMPLPLFVMNKDQIVTNASDSALTYCKLESSTLFGKPLFESVDLEFTSSRTLENWIQECQKNKVTDQTYWERVRIRLTDDEKTLRQCDMAASYNRDNPSGTEFIITIFDRSEQYNDEDTSVGFVALAVHELRTPLTVLRGYIEVFEEELSGKLDGELSGFLSRMQVSAKQLTAFVNNILNVARIDENQLTLKLHEENWENILRSSTRDIELLAQVHGIDIQYDIQPNLPTVAADRVSIYEVLNNLLDNAIKYSGESKKIAVTSKLATDGSVETTVQDFGVGIPKNVVANLFEKFYRNHRNKAQISGTGLGLFLSKSIVTAHGGNIWVNSKEGEGSSFTFSLLPYSQLADEQKKGDNTGIVRSAHGWIKNHSLYRR
jgi:signal transduction histidine kinase